MLKYAIRGINVEPINYHFDMACLPLNRSKDEFDRCAKICPVKLTTWNRNRFANKFQCFERIIVWHDGTANGVLMMGLLCMTETRPESIRVNTDENGSDHHGTAFIDSTGQEKNVTYPTDTKLHRKIAGKMLSIVKSLGLPLRQSYKFVLERGFAEASVSVTIRRTVARP